MVGVVLSARSALKNCCCCRLLIKQSCFFFVFVFFCYFFVCWVLIMCVELYGNVNECMKSIGLSEFAFMIQ